MTRISTPLAVAFLVLACGHAHFSTVPRTNSSQRTWQEEADDFLSYYRPLFQTAFSESQRIGWIASTDVSNEHTGARTGSDTIFAALVGNRFVIERTRLLLEHREALADISTRELVHVLEYAAGAPQTNPTLARRRVELESHANALLDGYDFCLQRDGERCVTPAIANDLDRILTTSTDVDERLRAWNASKEVGQVLRQPLLDLRDVRNGVAREMGYDDFFSFQVTNYEMTHEEMMTLLSQLVRETRPLYEQLHCYARYELAARFHQPVPRALPAHWLGNRWGQSWPGLVSGVDFDEAMANRTPEWIVHQAERFYTSMGFSPLPESFWSESDLYPAAEGSTRRKNAHASAWHIDLEHDVRSLMSVEPTWEWFTTAHHELGHIYYYQTYTRDEVPVLLREGANRAFHEGMGELIALAAGQEPYLREVNILPQTQQVDQLAWLLDSALTGPITFLPWSAGVMSHFEHDLYAENLSADELNQRWWSYVRRFQGIEPPNDRAADGCDACTKTHIIGDPAQYYDYAICNVLYHQLHDHICRNILHSDPRSCNYYGHQEVGDFLRSIMRHGATRDWRDVLREAIGSDLSAAPMLEYYRPLLEFLRTQNQGRDCSMPN